VRTVTQINNAKLNSKPLIHSLIFVIFDIEFKYLTFCRSISVAGIVEKLSCTSLKYLLLLCVLMLFELQLMIIIGVMARKLTIWKKGYCLKYAVIMAITYTV